MGRTPGATNKTAREHKRDAEMSVLKAKLNEERVKHKEEIESLKKK
jgi:hypothetical protein